MIKELASQIKSEEASGGGQCSGVTDLSSPQPPTAPSSSRPRGRPPRLDRGDYVGTSRMVQGVPPPLPPPMQNGHHEGGSNGIDHHHGLHSNGLAAPMDDSTDAATENSLNALLALSQKGLMKQEPASPAGNIKMD